MSTSEKDYQIDSRMSRLETIVETVSKTVQKIEEKLDTKDKINWAPIAIGVTVFFTVAGSVSTIYNARISTLNTAVEHIDSRTIELEKGAVERELKIQRDSEKIQVLEKNHEDIEKRVAEIERKS